MATTAQLEAHKAKMAVKRARRLTIVSDYPKAEVKGRIVAGRIVPYETGRTLGAGGYVASKNDARAYRKQS